MHRFSLRRIVISASAVATLTLWTPASYSAVPDGQLVTVLPFSINADEDLSFMKKGISRMFFSRLSWPGKVVVVPPKEISTRLKTLGNLKGDQLVRTIATDTGASYVLNGTVTQFDGSFSLDAKVYDIQNHRYMAFFAQSTDSNDLIDKVDRIAASINQRIFNRTTVTWEKIEQERQKQINDYKRKNPEHLMQPPQDWQPKEKIGWKIWKYLF